ncbi:MAG: hypothetical protein M3N46_09515 [Actinomycetota bacterium]|nr:hypothetical protein [Actinomycetota bacterium]
MTGLKRVSMAGADVSVTAAELADALLEYARELGRARTTDTVTIPVVAGGRASEASLLLGPASQIALTENLDETLGEVDLPGVEQATADVRKRLGALRGLREGAAVEDDGQDPEFVDFDAY